MYKKIFLSSIFSLLLFSCNTDSKKVKSNSSKKKVFSIEALTTKVGWTAYKTTDKVAVSENTHGQHHTKKNN